MRSGRTEGWTHVRSCNEAKARLSLPLLKSAVMGYMGTRQGRGLGTCVGADAHSLDKHSASSLSAHKCSLGVHGQPQPETICEQERLQITEIMSTRGVRVLANGERKHHTPG